MIGRYVDFYSISTQRGVNSELFYKWILWLMVKLRSDKQAGIKANTNEIYR